MNNLEVIRVENQHITGFIIGIYLDSFALIDDLFIELTIIINNYLGLYWILQYEELMCNSIGLYAIRPSDSRSLKWDIYG